MKHPCLYLFLAFFKISFFTVGGGPVMLAVMDQEFHLRRKLLSDTAMNDILAIIYSMPGAIGVNAALNIGYKLAGKKGSACALAGVLIPPVAIILFITTFVEMLKGSPLTGYAFISIRAAVTVFILFTVGNMMKKTFRCWKDVVIALFAFLAVEFVNLPAVYVVASCGLLGILMYRGSEE
ncbi:MAG: chromate transporter [Spirochaetia bacterium]|nr:chromate transporter [Spirochaetia bacterium]MBQ3713446.1 chromate transporter [Spirochaetia bacterium]MBQ6673962.1 chromate transporter [Spirochaetia bacterium]